ncbi:unnamed protein product [Litomosoides sigmodontis]|uniref:Uncharacterized protein n=1 Tax=Litomosoides sigmodontis TaxID=42156 RepID=A0A3P6SBI7_LITSI|nr:unnamed protein product [Litomosoides sigmodontis]
MLSQIGEEKCNSTLVDLVLYSESDQQAVSDKSVSSNNHPAASSGIKRKCFDGEKCFDNSSQKLLRTLQEKFTSSKRFHKVLVLRGFFMREFITKSMK